MIAVRNLPCQFTNNGILENMRAMFKNCLKYLGRAILPAVMVSLVSAAPPVYHLQATLGHEDFNQNETFWQATASVKSILGITRNSAFNLNADLYTRSYHDFEAKDRNGLLIEGFYTYLPSGGFTKPTYFIGLRHEIKDFDRSAQDDEKTSLILAAAIRIDDRVTLTPGFEWFEETSDLDESEVKGLFFNADFRLDDRNLVYLNLKHQDEQSEIDLAQIAASAARGLLGGGHLESELTTPTPSISGSSIDLANTRSKTSSSNTGIIIGFNHAIDHRHTLDISYEHIKYAVDDSSDVSGGIMSVDYFFKF